eukprot:TRINITY_DN7138_c0_g1_i8.p1 TRINITY_DN7138_c0_g1~~TRINITY_DN7138_c0_g1_i8.p1  ORF type:complete len:731 (+),score=115.47 TRINITY_DN7138_c0_g1_i8:22-2193(+)
MFVYEIFLFLVVWGQSFSVFGGGLEYLIYYLLSSASWSQLTQLIYQTTAMFWNVPGYSFRESPVEVILNRDTFSLEELFEEDELVQEAKSMNGRLVAFLKDKAVLQKLVRYLVAPEENFENGITQGEEDEKQEEEIQRKLQRYPFLACELICCEVEGILSNLVQTEELMDQLFSLLEKPRPINSTLAGYFGRVMSILLVKRTLEFMAYMHAHVSHLFLLVDHIDITSVQEIILRLIGADEQINMNLTQQHKEWLAESVLLPELVKRVSGQHSIETQTNAAEVLATIASTQPSLLATKLSQKELLIQLFEQALEWKGSVLVPALGVFISLLSPINNCSASQHDYVGQVVEDNSVRNAAALGLSQYLPQIAELLSLDTYKLSQQVIMTSYGILNPPLGWGRLKVIELVAALVASGVRQALDGVMEQGIIPQCMELFQQYAFNNLLHQAVVSMLATGIELGSLHFVNYIFTQCGLIQWMTQLPQYAQPLITKRESGSEIRAGYHGHITQLGMRLCHLALENEEIKNLLEGNPAWPPFYVNTLEPRSQRENVLRWACGRPSHIDTSMNSENSDSDEFQGDTDYDIPMSEDYNLYSALDDDLTRDDNEEDDDDDDRHARGAKQQYQDSIFANTQLPHINGDEDYEDDEDESFQNATEVYVSFENVHKDLVGKLEELHLNSQQQQNQQQSTSSQQQSKQQDISSNPDDFSDNKYWKQDQAFNFVLPDFM